MARSRRDRSGADATRVLRAGAGGIDLELARELLARGGMIDAATLIYAVRRGAVEVALFLQKAAPKIRDKYLAEAALARATALRQAHQTALAKQIEKLAKLVEPGDSSYHELIAARRAPPCLRHEASTRV